MSWPRGSRFPRLPRLRLRNPVPGRRAVIRPGDPTPGNPTPGNPTSNDTFLQDPGRLGDGWADVGEVVWAWIPYEEDATRGKDRPALVLEVDEHDAIVLQLTSVDHDRDAAQEAAAGRHWMDIGSGPWDSRGRPSEVRLDRFIRLPRHEIRREGARLDPAIFARVVAATRRFR